LQALLDILDLPAGTLHTGQEVTMLSGAPMDTELRLEGRVAQRTERGGAVICVIEFHISSADAEQDVLAGKTTVAVAL
jgi:hypothetical protein